MRCSLSTDSGACRDRCAFTSVLLLGALFALSASPCARVPVISALVIVGVPLMTFGVAAPSRLGLLRELGLLWKGLESMALSLMLFVTGKRNTARQVTERHRAHVEYVYQTSAPRMAEAIDVDPLRLHHARRLASLGTLLAILGGLSLPFTYPAVFTFGQGFDAAAVFGLDLFTFGIVGRLVAERILLRLFEASVALSDVQADGAKLRVTPLTTLLGAALGAVGALVIVSAGAVACAVETSWIDGASGLHAAAFWFIRQVAPLGLPLGIAAGAILGAGMGLARPER